MRLIFLSAFLALCAQAVHAADLSEGQATPALGEASAFTWSGAYAGVKGGGGWANGDFAGFGITGSGDANGGIYGAFAGYNYQFDNNLLIGIEGDVAYNHNEASIFGSQFGTDWAGSVRGRVGYAVDRALIYGTAGWATTRGHVDVPALGKDEANFTGYTLGVGIDYAFTNNLFGRIEYEYNDFGSKKLQGFDVNVDQHAVTVGLGIRF
ncbi:outer membrane protein [Agrobacterium tumefaciens]|uniref:outer membrane protein n=1 Tax=Agrobacterium tumefaciens TaxID=358 RepID=UPI000976EEBB|nr:hypothetical protein BV900_28040 [Agrobacterium tumefaciens]